MAKKSFDEIWGASYASDETKKNDKKSFDEIWGTSYKLPKNTGETVKAAPSVVLETTIEEKPVETKQPVKTANGLLTAEETNKVLQNYGIRPADQSEMYGFKESAGYVGEQALKGLQGGIGGLVNAASTFLDKPLQTINAVGNMANKYAAPKDYSEYDEATAAALRKKDAEIEQKRKELYGNLDENFLDLVAQKGIELGKGLIEKSQETAYDVDKLSGAAKFTGDVAKAVTGMAPSLAVGALAGPGAGLAVMGTGAYGQSLQQALDNGASYDDAVVYGLASAGVEIATEKLFGGLPFLGEGAVDDVLAEWLQSKLGTGTGKAVVSYLMDSIGEGAEEYISEVAGEFLVDIYTDERKDKDFFDRLIDVQDDAFYSFLLGAVTGGVMGAPGAIVDSIKTGKQTATQEVKQDQTNNIAEENQPVKAQEKSTEDPVLAGVRQMADAQIDAEAAQKQQTVEPVKQTDAITEGLKSDNMMVRYEAQRQNKQATIDSAKQTGADIKKATKIADYANKVGIRVVFKDLTYTDKNGKTVTPEGMYQNGVIYISPKTVNPMYQVFKHELTHYIEDSDFYQDFQNTIFSLYDATELDTMRENLRRERSDIVDEFGNDEARLAAEIDKELTAILSQDKIFTDKKTIDQLAHRKPNIVQTVYRWIKNKLAVARGEMTAEEVKIMETAEQLYREALEQQKNNKVENTNESKNLIAKTNTGSNVVVLDSLMFSKKHKLNAATRDKIFNAFKTLLPKKFEINSDGNIVNFNKTSPKEFWYSKYSNWLKKNDQDIMRAKNLVVGQLGELINISENGKLEPERKGVVHVKDPTIGKNGFYHYDTTFAIPKFDGRKNIIGYEVYEGELVLDNNEDGNVYFYDLINIKESNTTVDKMSIRPSNKAGRSLLSNNSISNYSNKASMSTGLNANNLSERRKDLMAVHNLSDTKLKKSLELGGMPYPSIAVTKDTIGHEGYGDVSLVFGKETIDPRESYDNKVYSRDAYTPTLPYTEYKLNSNNVKKANDYLKQLSEKIDPNLVPRNFLNDYLYEDATSNTIEDVWDKAKRDAGLKAAYLESIGKHVDGVYSFEKGGPLYSDDTKLEYENWHKTLTDEEFNDLFNLQAHEYVSKHGYNAIDNLLTKRLIEQRNYSEEKARKFLKTWMNFKKIMALDNAMRFLKNKDVINPDKNVFDTQATIKLIDENVDESAYKEWVYKTFGPMFGKAGLRNNVDTFTRSGNRKSFEQLHDAYTAENALKLMKQDSAKGDSNTPSLNTVFAAASNEFNDLQSIIDSEGLLSNDADLIASQLKPLTDAFNEVKDKHTLKDVGDYSYFSLDNTFMNASVAAFSKKYTTSSVIRKFKEYGFNLTADDANKLINAVNGSKELSTHYFEAKPERVVGFDEVNAAVIPNTLSEDIKEMLRERGVNMVEYDPSVEGDRKRVMNSLEDSKFSRGLSASELLGNSKDPAIRARYEMEKRIRGTFLFNSKSDPRKMYDITSRLEHEFNQTGKISEKSRQELFNAAYNETLKNADISYKELPEFVQMISEDLNRAVTQYENTLIKERELLKFAQENDIDVSEVKLNPTFGFLRNVKPEDLPDKIISYKKLKASLKSDLIGQVDKYAGGNQIDTLIDQAAKEILEDGFISSTTKFKIRQEMIENGYSINDQNMRDNKELYDFIKSTKFNVPRNFGREIQDYERTRKLLKTSTVEGMPIDQVYNELRSRFGEFFPDVLTNPADQYQQIYDVMAELEPVRLMMQDSEMYNAEIRQYLEDTFTDRLEDFKNQVVYRSQKEYYDRAAKKQVAQDSALNQISEAISEKFFKDNKEIDELKKTEDVIKSNVSIDELAQVVAKIRDRGALSKTLAQNLDAMAGGDVVLRAQLAEIFEKPLREAKRNYVTNQKRVLDDVYQRITQDLGIKMGSKESAAMMWYGEGKKQLNKVKGKVESDKLEFTQYTLDDLKKDFPETWKNIVEADSIMRKYYDEYVDRINQLLERIYSERNLKESVAERRTELQKEIREAMERLEDYKAQRQGEVGTPDVEARINAQRERIKNLSNQFNNVAEDVYRNKRLNKRSDYYHHFQEIGMVESIQEILKGDSANNISNALAGISENTKPKSKWASFMQKRSDVARYEEDAIKGFLKYAPAAEYKIAFDPYVAQMRGTIQDIIKLSDEANINNAKAINWLTNYTNALAGKTNPLDRWIAHTQSGRDVLQLLNKVNSRVKANAVAGNLNSAVSQFYNLPNGIAVLTDRGGVKAQIDLAKGSKDYAAYAAKKMAKQDVSDSPINQSVFLAERFIDSTLDRFDESILHKPQQAATFMLTFGDQVVAEQLWFSAYNQAQRLGKTDAIAYADDVVARAVGGRGIGEVPLAQQSQFVKLIAPFQVEVNNAWQLMKQMGSGALKDKDKALGLLLMYAATWLMNEINQVITGNRVGMDIFNAMQDAAEGWDSEKNVVSNTFTAAGRLGGEVLSNVPMGAQIAQKFVSDEYDRQKLFGESDPSRYGTGNIGINAIADPITQLVTGQNVDWQSVVTNFVTPYGGKQLNRLYKLAEDTGVIPRIDFNVNEGFQASKKPGAYNDKGNLKYQIDTTDPLNIAKGLAFGTYATKEGKKYIEQGYSALSENQTKIYESAVESGADLNYLYEAMRELPNIKSLKDDEGKTVKNSQAALSRLYLEQMGLYEDVVEGIGESGADPSGVKLSNTVINMTDEEFKKFLEELEKYRK